MNLNSKKLTIPDLISVGVFTAIYFVLVTIATFSCALRRVLATFCCRQWRR